MADNISLTIDGRQVEVPPGTLIVEAAKKIGIVIPTFCYDDRLRSVGACRMCLVEVEKMPKLVASCATPVAPNMVVLTESERVVKARKGVLEFLLINHPLDCPTCDKGGECPLQDLTYGYGPTASRYREDKIRFIEDINQKFDDIALGPEVLLNRNRCIMCYKCVRIVREQAGEADLGVFRRGAFANINVLSEVEFADEFSGNTVEYCPVGALTSRSFRYQIRDWLLKHAPSVCNLCPVGCNINIDWSAGDVFRHMSRRNAEVDDGWLCDRGRYSFDITRNPDRLVKPHLRHGSSLEPCGWDEAMALVAKHLRKITDSNKGAEVAVVGSSSLSNEEAFAIRLFFNDVIKTSEIDFQTDTNQPLEPEVIDLIGLNGSIKNLEKDTLFLFIGCDPAVEQPVAALRIKNAIAQKGSKAIFLGSYDKRLGYFPVENVRIPFGTEPQSIDFILSRFASKSEQPNLSGFDTQGLSLIVEQLKSAGRIHIISGRGFFNHPQRSNLLASLLKLRELTGGRLSILPPQGNYIGVSHFGLFGEPEHSFKSILAKIETGEIKTLLVFGANPVEEYPDQTYVTNILKKLEFLVVVAPFNHATASLASVVFPQALLPDYGGTFVNIEGRIQEFRPMSEKLASDFKPAWAILSELSDIMGRGTVWYHDRQIRQEMANNLKGMEGLTQLSSTGFIFSFMAAEAVMPAVSASIENPQSDLPYILQWTTSAHHNGWITEYSKNLMRIAGFQAALMHPDDAANEGINENQMVRIGNESAEIQAPVRITSHVNRGEILIINSFSKNSVNRLMNKDKLITRVFVKET